MANVPPIPSLMAGQVITSGQMANITSALQLLINPPRVGCVQNTAQSIPVNSWTAITWDSEYYDTDNIHSTSVNNNKFTIVTPGMYLVTATLGIASLSSGVLLRGSIRVNGTTYNTIQLTTGTASSVAAATLIRFNVGDYFEAVVYQSNAAATNTNVTAGYNSTIFAQWVGSS